MNHIRGVILEGFSHAGKTSVLNALKRLHGVQRAAERSIVALSEHYSQILNNVQGELRTLNQHDHLQLLRERVRMLRQLNEWAEYLGPDASRASRGLFFIMERFHLNLRAAFSASSLAEIGSLEQELLSLNATTVLLTVSPYIMERRMQLRTPAEWENKTAEQIRQAAKQFQQTQAELQRQASLSAVPTLEINTDEQQWEAYAQQILAAIDAIPS